MTAAVAGLGSWLLTYVAHSTLLLGGAWLLTRLVVRRESVREALWKAALVGGVVTATSSVVLDRPGAVRLELAALGSTPSIVASDEVRAEGLGIDASRSVPPAVDRAADRGPERVSGPASGGPEPVVPADGVTSSSSAWASGGDDAGGPGRGEAGAEAPVASHHGADGAVRPAMWLAALVALWALVAGGLLVRLGYRHVRLRRLLRDRTQVEGGHPAVAALTELRRTAGVWKPVRLTSTDRVGTPLALGGVEVCVPDRFLTELGPAEQRAALAHELAHLARRDPVWHVVGGIVGSVFFFQPLNALARREIRAAAEYLADGWAVAHTGSQVDLARCLAAVAGWAVPAGEPALAGTVAMAEGGSPLLARVRRLLEHEPESTSPALVRWGAAVALVAVAAVAAPAVTPAGAVPPGADAGASPGSDGAASGASDGIGAGIGEGIREGIREGLREALREADSLEVRRVDRPTPEGGSLVAALNEAARTAGSGPYWVAYAVPRSGSRGPALMSDSEPWSTRELRDTPLGRRLGVDRELAGGVWTLVLARLEHWGDVTRVHRLAVREPRFGMRMDGRVFWLGAVDPGESFRWLRDVQAAVRDEEIRETAVEAIAVHEVPEAEPFLLAVMAEDRESDVREAALEALAHERQDPEIARLLFDIAMRDPDDGLRRQAAEQLGHMPDSVAVPLLERLANEARDDDVQQQAAESLGLVGTPAARAALERLVGSHPHDDVRREALDQLWDSDAPKDPEILLRIALGDDRSLAREAVEHMDDLPADVAPELLLRIAFEGEPDAQRQAAETLGEVGSERALRVLAEILERHPSEDVAFQAVEAVAESFPAELALPILRRVLESHPSDKVREEALDQLPRVGALDRAGAALDGAGLGLDAAGAALDRVGDRGPPGAAG